MNTFYKRVPQAGEARTPIEPSTRFPVLGKIARVSSWRILFKMVFGAEQKLSSQNTFWMLFCFIQILLEGNTVNVYQQHGLKRSGSCDSGGSCSDKKHWHRALDSHLGTRATWLSLWEIGLCIPSPRDCAQVWLTARSPKHRDSEASWQAARKLSQGSPISFHNLHLNLLSK